LKIDRDRECLAHSPASRPSKVVLVLPAYNEEANLGKLLKRIQEAMEESSLRYQVVVVDDGSQDRTPGILREFSSQMPMTVSRHEVNLGLGVSIRDGLYLAAQIASENDVIVTMDSDETHTPGLILRMVRMVREGHDVVIASRFQPGSRIYGLSTTRRLVSYLASLLCRIVFPTQGVRDFTCGYRAYRAEALKGALDRYGDEFIRADGFQCMVDILLKLRRMDVVFGEAPLILRYDLKRGVSKMRMFRTARQTLALLIRRRLGIYDDG
jgi:dolichol-phosphate mannosyltransferase